MRRSRPLSVLSLAAGIKGTWVPDAGGGAFMRRWCHGPIGIACADDPCLGAGLAFLPLFRTWRAAREHHGQPRRAVLERCAFCGAVGRAAGNASPASGAPPDCRITGCDGVGTAVPAAQPRDRPGKARRDGGTRAGTWPCRPPPYQTHTGIEGSAPRRQEAAVSDQTAAAEADGRLGLRWLVPG